jgi:hypothetical protein
MRDAYVRYLRPDAGHGEQIWVGRLLVFVIVAAAMIVAFTNSAAIVLPGGLATAFGFLLYVPLLDVLYLPKFTGPAMAWALGPGRNLSRAQLSRRVGPGQRPSRQGSARARRRSFLSWPVPRCWGLADAARPGAAFRGTLPVWVPACRTAGQASVEARAGRGKRNLVAEAKSGARPAHEPSRAGPRAQPLGRLTRSTRQGAVPPTRLTGGRRLTSLRVHRLIRLFLARRRRMRHRDRGRGERDAWTVAAETASPGAARPSSSCGWVT